MADESNTTRSKPARGSLNPFRRAVLRGLGVVLPPLLTIVILVWVWNTVQNNVLVHVETAARYVIVWSVADIHDDPPGDSDAEAVVQFEGESYRRLDHGEYVPVGV